VNGMLGWGLAIGAGLAVAWLAYPAAAAARWRLRLMGVRSLAVMAIVALLLDLAIGSDRPSAPLVALDVSSSWTRSVDRSAWRAALDSARLAAGDGELILFGDSARRDVLPESARDAASAVAPAVQLATLEGRRLLVITDGALDDPEALQQTAAGSRLLVMPPAPSADRAITDIGAPRDARAGDTITVTARVASDGVMPASATLRWLLDGIVLADVSVPVLPAGGEAVVESRVVIPVGDSLAVLRAVLAADDAQPRNDTLAVAFRRGARQRVVIVSTAPDADVRDLASALRTNVAMPTDAYYRIAPGRWLREGALQPVQESQVRAAVRGATLAVLHGDTASMGLPAALGTRALLLLVPPADEARELLVRVAPPSPLQGALSGMVVESLPPLLATTAARGGVAVLTAAPGFGVVGLIPIATVLDGEVRRMVVTAAGYGRWRARGGVSEAAFQAFVGAATDWLLAARGRTTAPELTAPVVRTGLPLGWRRGALATSALQLTRDGDRIATRASIQFADGALGTSPPLAAGIWRGTVDGAAVIVPVSQSREWLPRPIALRSGPLNGEARPIRRGARTLGWLYLASLLLLAAEWLLRRQAGLR